LETPTNNEEYRKTFPNRALEATERPASFPSRFAPAGKALFYSLNGKLFGTQSRVSHGEERQISAPARNPFRFA